MLLILLGIIALIIAGSAVASIPFSSPPNQAAPSRRAPAHGTTEAPEVATPTRTPTPTATATPTRTPPPAPQILGSARLLAAAPDRYLLLNPTTAAPGAAVQVSGGGFAAGVALHLGVQMPGQAPSRQAEVTTGANGSFRATITMPATQTATASEVVAQDAQGHSAAATLLLRVGQPLAALSPNIVTPGAKVAVTAAGFRAGETVRVYFQRMAGRPILTGTADANGAGSWPITVPYGPGGVNQLVVVGDVGRNPVVAQYLLLNLYPRASVSDYAPLPGMRVTFNGAGFGPNEPVELRMDRPDGPVLAVAQTNARGGLAGLGPYRLPYGLSGVHAFILRGVDSRVVTTVTLTVMPFWASVQPSTYAAGPGTTLTFYGKGFAPDEIVRVFLGRTATRPGTEVAALRTTPTGRLIGSSGSYTLPGNIRGSTVAFALIGDISGAQAWTSVHYMRSSGPPVIFDPGPPYHPPPHQQPASAIKPGPRPPLLAATPPRVVAGGLVSLLGTGFAPRTTVRLVLMSRDNPQGWALRTARVARTDVHGVLNITATIPSWITRADMVRAYPDAKGAAAPAQAELDVWPALPGLTPSTYSGTPGSPYGLTSYGFTPGEKVSLYFDSVGTPALATTISSGGRITFSRVPVPVATAGNHTFVVKGDRGEVASIPFTELPCTPFLLLSTYSTQPEQPVSVGGQGFAPHETVHVWIGSGTRRFVGGGVVDGRGTLHAAAPFMIPTDAHGKLQVVAVSTTSARTLRATLTVLPFGPALWLTSYAGHPGATVAFTGKGWAHHEILQVYLGEAATPVATFRAHNGAFRGAGTIRIPVGTPGGMIPITVRGALSHTKVTMKYMVIAYTPGAGYQILHRHGYTIVRLGAGGFAPHEAVRLYLGTQNQGTPLRVLHADAAGRVPLLQVLSVRGKPQVSLTYTLVGAQSGAQATAVYPPPPGR